MQQPLPWPLKLHYKLPLHIMGLCPIIQIGTYFSKFFLNNSLLLSINIPPTIDAPAFTNLVGEFFRILELEFPIKNS
jgi:hypothetical protein